MSALFRERRDAGLYDPDEQVRLKAAAKLDKEMDKRRKAAEEVAQADAEDSEK
jgi:hypothetical protein